MVSIAALSVSHNPALSQESSTIRQRVLQAAAEGADALRALSRDNPELSSHETLVALARSFASDSNVVGAEATVLLAESAGADSTLADVLRMSAIAQAAMANYEQADSSSSRALRLYESLGDDVNRVRILLIRGNFYLAENRPEHAAAAYSMAYDASEALLPFRMAAAMRRGYVLLKLRRFDEAEGDFRHAKAAAELLGSTEVLSASLVRLAELTHRRGVYDSALSCARNAVEVARSIPNPEFEAEALLSFARSAYMHGDAAEAAEALDSALSIFKRIGTWNRIGEVLRLQAQMQLETGDAGTAGLTAREALLAVERANDVQGQANAVKTLANIALYLGDPERAERLLDRAAGLARAIGDVVLAGNLLTDKAQLAYEDGRYDEAELLLEKALPAHEKSGSKLGVANALQLLGETALMKKNHDAAENSLRRAAGIFAEIGEITGECNALRSLGRTLTAGGRFAEARAYLHRALSLTFEHNAGANAAYCCHDLAILHEKAAELDSAASRYDQAVQLLSGMRATAGSETGRLVWQRRHAEILADALRFMADNGRPEKAFQIGEHLKARVMLDRVALKTSAWEFSIPSGLRRQRDSLESAAAGAKTRLFRLRAGERAEREKLNAELLRVNDDLEVVRGRILSVLPEQASALQPRVIDVTALRRGILKHGETLASFHVSDSALYAFLIDRDSFRMRRIPVPRERLKILCRLLLQQLRNPSGIPETADPVSREILHPLLDAIPSGNLLIVTPDADLAAVPFEALSLPAGDKPDGHAYLLERNPVSYAPSASFLAYRRGRPAGARRSGNLLAFGDPLYTTAAPPAVAAARNIRGEDDAGEAGDETETTQRDLYLRAGGVLQPLPGSAKEVETIKDLFLKAGRKAQIHTGAEAREETVKNMPLKDFAYVLFACHGVIGAGFQGLVLTQDPSSDEDGYLTIDEMMSLRFDASLVALSACRTGEGAHIPGEGLNGLTQAVMSAGADAVVSSLWSVDDEKTTELMTRLFARLIEDREAPHDALRLAKLEMLKQGAAKHPFFWSPFIVYGE